MRGSRHPTLNETHRERGESACVQGFPLGPQMYYCAHPSGSHGVTKVWRGARPTCSLGNWKGRCQGLQHGGTNGGTSGDKGHVGRSQCRRCVSPVETCRVTPCYSIVFPPPFSLTNCSKFTTFQLDLGVKTLHCNKGRLKFSCQLLSHVSPDTNERARTRATCFSSR